MTVAVKFSANVKQMIGRDELTLTLDPSKDYCVKDILSEISKITDNELSTMLITIEGKSRGAVRVRVNGKEIHCLGGLKTKVQDGDRIMLFPLLAGG